ncbi:GNAT family N-acetyltransferase [Streptomyces sp. NPDC050560]|uniref:GNAT family N-acetyltransferase n=1 Tax=Streptomyces sp. NPDC050560 TaxID=3365630 RepID=UPI00379C29EB
MSTPTLTALPIRRLTPRDLMACADLSEDRGWPREEHKWSLLLAAGRGYGIDAPDGGLVCACVVTTYEQPSGGAGFRAIGMMLVAERYSRRGVGRRLLRHVVAESGAVPLTLYATSSGRPLYEETGFKAQGRARTLRGAFTPEGTEEVGRTRPATAEDLPAILRLDEEAFGADRTHVITRLPAFTRQLRVAESGGELVGYAAAWPNESTDMIGPLIARDLTTARALVASLAAHTDRPLRADVDVRHEALSAWLGERGLAPTGEIAIMHYGTTELPGDRTLRLAPLTVAAG